jgi:2-oxoglutarate dehydrogenase E2 component (dihydrolipoamide succinyltransferase)
MGESIFEGTITKWLKKPGDPVEKDEPLFEISTDKVDAEIPSPVAGVLMEIKVPVGATVEINTVVAVVGEKQGIGNRDQGTDADAAAVPTDVGTAVVMPQMGESIFEGTITKWLKQVGSHVEKDEPLFEISTDKVDAEIPAPVAGVLTEIKVPVGATVEINTVVAIIGGSGGAANRASVAADSGAVLAAPASMLVVAEAPVVQAPLVPVAVDGRRLRSSPLVRRIAKENRLDLRRIAGTGAEGRITKEDVLRHLSAYGPGGASSPVAAQPAPKAQLAAPQAPEGLEPLTKMRAIIAQRMVESMQIAPHVHTVYKVDMTRIVRLRERERAGFEQRNAVKLTFMPFVATAVVEALRKFPIVNASLESGGIRYHGNINLGIAVALEWGLIVPVVKQAEGRTFADLARTIADLAERARSKKLMPDDVTGSTFTLTNSGVFGDEFSTPIINQPDSAILCISGMKKEAVVLTDAEGNDTIAIRTVEHFTLGFDHRIIDGADACKFMLEFKKTLEGWDREIG